MRRISWSRPALRDIDAIYAYALEERPEYIGELLTALDQARDFIHNTPNAGSPAGYRDWRKWRVGRTPYLYIYAVRDDMVRILRVYHDRQDWP